jgi:dTDP-4-dehydrorhamnose 3,5-epimerase
MKIEPSKIEGVYVVTSEPRQDQRGHFSRLYEDDKLTEIIGKKPIRHVNQSFTFKRGTIRGLHFQNPPFAEIKMVRCLCGRILDIAVDLRQNSETFLHYHAEELTPENNRMLIVPEGFAHGFQTLEDNTETLYLNTEIYNGAYEGGIRYNDPKLGIVWPLPVVDISDKDNNHPFLGPEFTGMLFK